VWVEARRRGWPVIGGLARLRAARGRGVAEEGGR